MRVKLLSYTPDPEIIVASAAKLCYSNKKIEDLMNNLTQEEVEKFVKELSDIGHESPFEHISFTFGIEGVSRSLLAQLTRHRIASYSVKSQRYVKENQFEYIIPHAIENIPEAKEIFMKTMENNQIAYNKLVDLLLLEQIKDFWRCEGVHEEELIKYEDSLLEDFKERYRKGYNKLEKQVIEDARYVFPNACETKIIFTMNARSLFNFFSLRCCNRAQWEIKEVANEMLKLVKNVAPNVFKYAGRPCIKGYCPEGNMQCEEFKGKIPTLNILLDSYKKGDN